MSKKLPIYFSDHAWDSLQSLMGANGKPSPTINALLESKSILELPLSYLTTELVAKPIVAKTHVQIPLVAEKLSAGFPSPAQDYIEKSIDLNELLIGNQAATFIGEVNSLSMLNAGIDIGDKLIIDRSLSAVDGDIVVALIDNDFTVKRLVITSQETYLQAENPEFSDIHLKDGQELIIWGVVTDIIKHARKRKK